MNWIHIWLVDFKSTNLIDWLIDVGWWWTLHPSVSAAGSGAKSHQYYHEQVYSVH